MGQSLSSMASQPTTTGSYALHADGGGAEINYQNMIFFDSVSGFFRNAYRLWF